MKLKHFTPENVSDGYRHYLPSVHLNCKVGLISINGSAAHNLELEEGSKIEFLQDEDNPMDWYIMKSNNENAFVCKKARTGSSIVLHSTNLARKIILSCKITELSVTFGISKIPIIEDKQKMFAIITKSTLLKK